MARRKDRPRGPLVKPSGGGKPYEDLTGLTFGLWTVEALSHRSPDRHLMWRCRCSCGEKTVIDGGDLKDTGTGGCRKCKATRQERLATNRLMTYAAFNAKARGIEFKLNRAKTISMLAEQDFKYALSGVPIGFALSAKSHMHGGTTASLDRIDSTKGYVPGNVQWVHKDVNRMKSDLALDRFIELCRRITERSQSWP